MKKLIFVCAFILASCAISPTIGMSLSSWQEQCRGYSWTNGQLVAADSETQVYTCHDPNQVYIFQNDRLVMIDRVQAPSNPNQAAGIYNALLGMQLLNQSN